MITGIIVLSVMALLSLARGLASLHFLASEQAVMPVDHRTPLAADMLQRSIEQAERTRKLAPSKADYALTAGDRYLARIKSGLAMEIQQQDAAWMLKHYADAVNLRPSWAAAWARLAVARYSYYGMDTETLVAYKRSMDLGLWEPEVIGRVTWLTMHGWSALTPEHQEQAWSMMRQATMDAKLASTLQQQAKDAGWSGFLRRIMREKQHADRARQQSH